ncbi:MAG: zinc ribbon domain-containing protein [Deltaproteobacteria bacterium]|nr:zinc ribbon domain-containing protein [Deltaproteobacteria bacterium]
MPIYEYHCEQCGRFEVMHKVSEEALQSCPQCQRPVTRLISPAGFILKGTGWYLTDYARKGMKDPERAGDGDKAADSKDGDAAKKGSAKAESKSDGSKGSSETG